MKPPPCMSSSDSLPARAFSDAFASSADSSMMPFWSTSRITGTSSPRACVHGHADVHGLLVDDLAAGGVDRRVELRKLPHGRGDHLERNRGHGELAARAFRLRPELFAERLDAGDVRLVVLCDVRDDAPRVAEMIRRLPADVAHRLPFDLAPLREVREIRRSGAPAAASAAGKRCLHELLHVFHADATFGPGPLHQPNLHAELARQSPHRWSCWRRRALSRRFAGGGCGVRAPLLISTTSPRFFCTDGSDGSDGCRSFGRIRNLHGRTLDFPLPSLRCAALRAALVFGLIARRGLRIRGRLLTNPPAAAEAWRRPRRLRLLVARLRRVCLLGGRAIGNGEHDLPDLHFLARFDAHFTDGTGDARRHFDGGLVGLELEDRLILLDGVSRLDQHADDVARGDVLAEFGELEFCRHQRL